MTTRLGIIPARGGSKEIPFKNKRLLCGKALIMYTIEAALDSNLDHVVVSTDDQDIKDISSDYKITVVDRPESLSGDDIHTLPVIQHVLENVDFKCGLVMTLQPTSPFRTAEHINEALSLFESNSEADSLVSVVDVPHNMVPESLMVNNNGFLEPFFEKMGSLRRQDKSDFFARNGAAIYISSLECLKHSILGRRILAYKMNKLDSIDIDDEDDWKLSEVLMLALHKND